MAREDVTGLCVTVGQVRVALPHTSQDKSARTDKTIVKPLDAIGNLSGGAEEPWVLQMKAISLESPGRLVRLLTGAILGCGGWVLSRGTNETGRVSLLFEFERHACVEIYTVLVATGLELNQSGHMQFTELCQCTRLGSDERRGEIASIDLEIQTYPLEDLSGEPPTSPGQGLH
jgi:hypothetical protein